MLWEKKLKASQRIRDRQQSRIGAGVGSGWNPILEFMRNNPLVSLWNGVLFCGGGILLIYHASITYLPDFSLSDLAGLLPSVRRFHFVRNAAAFKRCEKMISGFRIAGRSC